MSEKVTIKVERKTLHLPTIALRGLVVFPNNLVHFEVGREKSIAAVEWAMANNSNVFLVAQKSMDTTDPAQADLFTYGVVAEVKQVLRVSEDLVKVLVEGKYRAKLTCSWMPAAIFCFRRCARPRCAQARPTTPWRPKRCCAPSRPGLTSISA